ncbi:hypothetical protein Rhopal_004435-T1 [Rhodotorula paludigena]|uniref:Bulb-type lectin domain-containing protein n=1 Tax=Rhodotorula paludigena TaxID=86838 RepID=A0AAV5GQ81_9BASI|nr:hypothetical protein Rhopal_004435-T1 [Rhodotorula paludigena]
MGPPTHIFHPLPHARPGGADVENGAAISELFRSGGPGTTVLLAQRQTYVLFGEIDMAHPGTTLATQGFPTFESGNQAVLETRAQDNSVGVRMLNLPRCAVKRVHIRGCRGWGTKAPSDEEKERWKHEGRMGWLEGGGPLIVMGGPEAYEQMVEGCRLEDPRGWTGVHLVDFAQRCRVINNLVGPCGQQAPGPWADGLSIAGKDSVVAGNTVFDATDGAIVLFCAPGTVCANNTIIARERNLLGAINMVDDFPFDRNFDETRVIGNTIKTEGAFIRVAIACGPTSWNPWGPGHTLNYGGQVLHNYIGPGQLGYGITLSGTKNFTVLGNEIMPSTRFAGSTHRFYPATINAPPSAFVRQWPDRGRVLGCDVQPDFVEGELQWVIGIEPEVGDKLEYEGGQVSLDMRGMSRAGEGGLALRGARWEVGKAGELLLRRVEGKTDQFGQGEYGRGSVVWASGSSAVAQGVREVEEPQLDFHLDGTLATRSKGGHGDTLWDPTSYLAPFLAHLPPAPSDPDPSEPTPPEKWLAHPKLILQNRQPYLQLKHRDGHLVYSTSYEWTNQDGWQLHAGQWIAIAPRQLRGYLDPQGIEENPQDGSGAPPPPPASQQQPPHDQGHHGGRFSSFVRDIGQSLQERGINVGQAFPNMSRAGGPPPIPPRPGSHPLAPPQQQGQPHLVPTFLYLSPETSQLILHSSPTGPTNPQPEHVHWSVPNPPVQPAPKNAWLTFQGDGNFVMYAEGGPCWASGTNGDNGAEKFVLRAADEEGGPAFELYNKHGHRIFSSRG